MSTTDGTDLIVNEIDTLSGLHALHDELAARLKKVDEQISQLERGILAAMNAAGILTIGGASATATIHIERVYKGEDWPKLYARIRMTGEFDLLHRRLSIPAVREREQAGDLPQGVVAVNLAKIKLTAPKG
jgi:hypothetical protein